MRKPSKSLADTKRHNRRAGRDIAALMGVDPHPMDVEPTAILLTKRISLSEFKKQYPPKRTESDVQREILSFLQKHPLVAIVRRVNSGAMQIGNRYVRFNSVRSKGQRGLLLSDIECLLKDGRTLSVECKTPDWVPPPWNELAKSEKLLSEKHQRELGQRAYLRTVKRAGGIGIFATCLQDVIDALQPTI